MANPKEEAAYKGNFAKTVIRSRQHHCACGAFSPCDTVIAVDANFDPDLACRATEFNISKAINVSSCRECNQAEFVHVPFTYHNGNEGVFVLVLPVSYRHRELEERAHILRKLAHEGTMIPRYVVDFSVAYGAKGLGDVLKEKREGKESASHEKLRQRELEERVEKAVLREQRLSEREDKLISAMAQLDDRSSELTERDISLKDRKSALDRRSQELKDKTEELKEARLQLQDEARDQGSALLSGDQTQKLDIDDILTSAPDPNGLGELRIPSAVSVAGSSSVGRAPLPAELGETEALALLKRARAGSISDIVTQEALQLEEQTDPSVGRQWTADLSNPLAEEDPKTVRKQRSLPEVLNVKTPKPQSTWRNKKERFLKTCTSGEVGLHASIPEEGLKELQSTDLRALLQLHRMPTYALVTLTLATASTLAGQAGDPVSFHFDVTNERDRQVLEQLADDFTFHLKVFDLDYGELHKRNVRAPLASNIRYVISLALDTLDRISPKLRSYKKAVSTFEDPRYDRLGRRHEFARHFKDSALDKLGTFDELKAALAMSSLFSDSAHEEYLIGIRSYPFDRWTRRRLNVIKQALKFGIWIGPTLAQIAVSEELVRSRKDLVVQSQDSFARFTSHEEAVIDSTTAKSNWADLGAEARRLGLTPMEPEPPTLSVSRIETEPLEEGIETEIAAEHETVDMPGAGISIVASLCQEPPYNLEAIAQVFADIGLADAPGAFAILASKGEVFSGLLHTMLASKIPFQQQGAALTLCAIGDEEGIDTTCDLLMSDTHEIWHELAIAIGKVGSSAIMPLVARIASRGDLNGQKRGVWALAYIVSEGTDKPVTTLSKGKDTRVAQVALAALDLGKRISLGQAAIAAERGDWQRAFSSRFYQASIGKPSYHSNTEISGAMLLDESDLIEATD